MYIAKIPEKQIDIECFYTYYHQHKKNNYIFSGQRHPFWEMNIVLNGAMTMTCDDKIINLSKGQLYLIRPNEFHRFMITQDSMELIVLTFKADFAPADAVYTLSDDSLRLVRILMDEMKEKFSNDCFNSGKKVPQSIKLITELLIDRAVSQGATPCVENVDSDIYEKVVKFMKANIFNKITLNDISAHCCVSNSTIKNLFKQHTNCGVMHYFNDLKMEYAKKMLIKKHSVNSIAEELNFSSAAHFSAAFKKTCGVSPLTFKKTNCY